MSLVDFQRRVDALTQLRVASIDAPVLAKDDAHHLFTVLRAKRGEEVVLTDGAGAWRFATVGEGDLRDLSAVQRDPEPTPRILYLAPIKGDRGEWAIAKATELGVTTVVPLLARRVAFKFKGEVRDKLLTRWRRLALEAAGQCRRTYDLVVTDPVEVRDVPVNVAVAIPGATGSLDDVDAIAIGPEGGWELDEWSSANPMIGLGETILRTETAVVAASVLLASRGSGWPMVAGSARISKDEEQ